MSKKKNNSKKKKNLILAIALGVLSFFLAFILLLGYFVKTEGIGFLSNLVSLSRRGPDVGEGFEKITFEEGDEEASMGERELPESFPKDFPTYPEATLVNSWTATGNTTEGVSVVWQTPDSLSIVSEYYQGELEKSGWTAIVNKEGDSATITFEKDKVSGFIGITKGEGDITVISVTLGIEK